MRAGGKVCMEVWQGWEGIAVVMYAYSLQAGDWVAVSVCGREGVDAGGWEGVHGGVAALEVRKSGRVVSALLLGLRVGSAGRGETIDTPTVLPSPPPILTPLGHLLPLPYL